MKKRIARKIIKNIASYGVWRGQYSLKTVDRASSKLTVNECFEIWESCIPLIQNNQPFYLT